MRCCCYQQIFKVKGVNAEDSFMSVQAIHSLGSIGLLGEYCPLARKKNSPLPAKFDCMHLGPFREHSEFHGCSWSQPFVISEDLSSLVYHKAIEEDIAAFTLSSGIYCV
ncbi:hypothetical protein SLA2020_302460 [Shorea laevis]